MNKPTLLVLSLSLVIISCAPDEPLTFWDQTPSDDFKGNFIHSIGGGIYSFTSHGDQQISEECQSTCNGYGVCFTFFQSLNHTGQLFFNRSYNCNGVLEDNETGIYTLDITKLKTQKILTGNYRILDMAHNASNLALLDQDMLHVYAFDDQFALSGHTEINLPDKEIQDGVYELVSISPSGEKIVVFEQHSLTNSIDLKLHFYSYAFGQLTYVRGLVVTGGSYDSHQDMNGLYLDHSPYIDPSWSHDSRKLAFVKNGDIFTVEANGASLFNRTSSHYTFDKEPTWSPNENLLAFVSGIVPPAELGIINDNTETRTPLSISNELNGFANIVWSSDGQKLAFSGSYSEVKDIEYTDIFGNTVTGQVLNTLENGLFVLNPDGTEFLKISNKFLPIVAWYGGN